MTRRIRLYLGSDSECSYLPERKMANAYADPELSYNQHSHSELNAMGFRRSGGFLYQPHCQQCRACQSMRIPVAEYQPARRERRIAAANTDVANAWRPAEYRDYHYFLYESYLRSRHAGGGMDEGDPDRYKEFLFSPWGNTQLMEFRVGPEEPEPQPNADPKQLNSTKLSYNADLLGVAVVDELIDGLSAVYSFYDPKQIDRNPGHLMILRLIEAAKAKGLPYLYLGYWTPGAARMEYKSRYRPMQLFDGQHWNSFKRGDELPQQREV